MVSFVDGIYIRRTGSESLDFTERVSFHQATYITHDKQGGYDFRHISHLISKAGMTSDIFHT